MRRVGSLALLALSGCATVGVEEHRAFVEASRRFHDAVAPVYSRSLADPALPPESVANRRGLLADYGRALRDAEARIAGGKPEPVLERSAGTP